MRILALGPESYRGFAGIAQGTRDYLRGLLSSPQVDGIDLLARRAPDGGPEAPAEIREYSSPGSQLGFTRRALGLAAAEEHAFVFCLHVNLMPVAALLKRIHGLPIWLAIHGIDAWDAPRSFVKRRSIRAADFVTSSSRFTRERFLDWASIDPANVAVNNNPFHPADWGPGPKPDYLVERYGLRGRKVLLTLGRMLGGDRFKGHDEILAALPELVRRHPNLTWLVVGTGPDRQRIEREAARRGLADRVVFAGRVPDEEKRDHYLVSDAYAMPSCTEGFGIVYLEAAACGLPVLGSTRDGSRDALVDGQAGILVDPLDPADLLRGLDELLGREKAVPSALASLDYEHMAERMRAMLDERFAPEPRLVA